MKNGFFLFLFCSLFFSAYAQQTVTLQTKADSVTTEKYASEWIKDLYEKGLDIRNDTVKMNEECKRIIGDAAYRKIVYPDAYSWSNTSELLKIREFKKAFWYLINLYQSDTANKAMVIRSLFSFDGVLEMDKVLVSTFYTYAMLDPKVSMLLNGKYQVMHPELLEGEFKRVKELVAYILYYRQRAKENTAKATGK